ncbi:hypothetical protein WN943_023493 [Citrus x changshan-huyou]
MSFHLHNMIGQGSFGFVYKRNLGENELKNRSEEPEAQSRAIGMKGTVSYTAPANNFHVFSSMILAGDASMTGDVYSFRILLLEMFTRRRLFVGYASTKTSSDEQTSGSRVPRACISCKSVVAGGAGAGISCSSTIGETCSPVRESRHEGHATTHDYRNGASTFERWEDNEREWKEGLSSEGAYKKVANEASEGLHRGNNRCTLTCFCVRRNFWRRNLTRRDPDRGGVDRVEILVVERRQPESRINILAPSVGS